MKNASVMRALLLAVLTSLSISACGQLWNPANNKLSAATLTSLEQADQFELLVLRPAPMEKGNFHGYKVLATTRIEEAETRKNLISALVQSTHESKGDAALCFNPRHGIRATTQGKHADLVICFECLQMKVYAEGDELLLITSSPQTLFNRVLKQRGIAPPSR